MKVYFKIQESDQIYPVDLVSMDIWDKEAIVSLGEIKKLFQSVLKQNPELPFRPLVNVNPKEPKEK